MRHATRTAMLLAPRTKTKRARKSSRSNRPAGVAPSPTSASSPSSASFTTMAAACQTAAEGLSVCAKRTRDGRIAVAARSASDVLRTLQAACADHVGDGRWRARTHDRLRWEWLASTAMVVDGSSDARLLDECAKVLARGLEAAKLVASIAPEIASRYRLASAEAYSLSAEVGGARAQAWGDLAPVVA